MTLLFLTMLAQAPPVIEMPSETTNPHTSQADIEQGKKLFAGRCAGCHGPDGDGGQGANLAVPVLPRAQDDRGLYRVVRYGIPETEMPRTMMAPREVWQIAAFVRTLGKVDQSPVPGDPQKGELVFRKSGGCLACHAIGSQGGLLGPDLSDVGAKRGPAFLRAKVLDPQADVPEQFRMVSFTRAGQRIEGVRINEDTFSVQVRDFQGGLHSYWKSELADLRSERRTPMPASRNRLSGEDVDDVLAYLSSSRASSRGRQ